MKLLLENWREYLKEEEESLPVSEFSPEGVVFSVYVVSPEDTMYDKLKFLFKKDAMGHGFFFKDHNLIVIDGGVGLNDTQLKAVEAHEAAHGIYGHEEYGSYEVEKEADELAIELLDQKGYHKAAELLRARH